MSDVIERRVSDTLGPGIELIPGEYLEDMEMRVTSLQRPLPRVPFSYTMTKIKLHTIHFYLMDLAMATRVFFEPISRKRSDDLQLISPEWAKIFFTLRRTDLETYTLPQHHLINILQGLDIRMWEGRRDRLKEELVESMCREHRKKLTLLYVYRAVKPTLRENRVLLNKKILPDYQMDVSTRGLVKSKRADMSKRLLTNTVQMRFALWQANSVLPVYVVDLLELRDKEYRALGRVCGRVEELVSKFDRAATSLWYQKIVDMVMGHQASIMLLPVSQQKPLVSLLNQFIKEQVVCIKERTIERALSVVGSVRTSPLVNLRLAFFGKEKISLIPSYSRVIQNYIHMITQLNRAGVMLPKLEYHVMKEKLQFIRTEGTPSFISGVIKKIIPVAVTLLAPIMQHVRNLENEFSSLIAVENLLEYESFRSRKQPMEDLCTKLVFFKDIYKKILGLSKFEYIDNFRINQTELIGTLSHLCQRIVTDLILELSLSHVSEIVQFSIKMLDLNKLAMMVPKTTKDLVDLGKYMNYASTKLMLKYKDNLKRLIHIAITIIDHHEMLTDHMDLLSHAVFLFKKGKSIFESFSSMFEATKFELEDRMHCTSEVLTKFVVDFIGIFDVYEGITDVMEIHENIKIGTRLANAVDAFYPIIKWINGEETLFNMPISTYPEVEEYKELTYGMLKLFWLVSKWFRTEKLWMYGEFTDLDAIEVEDNIEIFQKTFTQLQKNYKGRIKQQIAEDYPKRFKGFIDDPDFDSWPTPLKLIHTALQSIKAFRVNMPLISILSNSAMTSRHWEEMSELVGFDIAPISGTSLSNYIEYHLEHLMDSFEIISVGATKEKELRENLERMMAEWENLFFTVNTFKETGLPILSGVDDVQAVLDEHLVKTLSMRGSAFVKPVQEIVTEWYNLLVLMNNTIEEWGKVQISWLYMLPIFSSKDIVAQMPEEGALFQEVDSAYRAIMKQVEKEARVKNTAGHPGLYPILLDCTEKLELVFAGVNRYLESKRLFFPRFFFLSNEEMLEILSETKDPLRVQPHLKKCFEGIAQLTFDPDLNILGMESAEGEKVTMVKSISTAEARGSVEKWLLQVEEVMILSVREEIYKSLKDYTIRGRSTWVLRWPGQVVLCVSCVTWTTLIEDVLTRKDHRLLGIYNKGLNNQLGELIQVVRGKLSKQSRITLGALVVLDVHAKDVTLELFQKGVVSELDFEWQAQLRYYVEDEVYVRLINATIEYAYEYLGTTPRLVITPLTDRCYRTLIGAYHLHLNGAPEGPAGTGKTETTKDLAKALAVQCVVFNCSDGLDYLAMAKFFKGLAAAGAWACFDEFNRIDIEVLSVIAQQILCIVQAVRNDLEEFLFEGTLIKLNPKCYVCITMNPGYAGRSELPDNLKVLFRTVAMMVPDYAMIGEISLYSYGFIAARSLSVKIVSVYRLCSEQLSSQSHYDYGMRAVKSVLTAAGNLKQKFPLESEDILLLRSIIDVNLPKFLNYDVPLFQGIVSDLFPSIVLPTPNYDLIISTIHEVCEQQNLQPRESFIIKIIQTYEMMIVRHGFMLVGDPFSGKTTTLHILSDVLSSMKRNHDQEDLSQYATMNPKAVTLGQLYGQYDLVSHDWYDGILAKIYRGFVQDPCPDRKWVIFDGPVDAVWIENMNTVLDDNKKLCLNSGEVIQMTPVMSIIFEVMDLLQASPATVSRCGMIYMEPQTLGWRPHVESWYSKIPKEWFPERPEMILELFDWIIPHSITFIQRNCKTLTYGGYTNPVWSTINILNALMQRALESSPETKHVTVWWFAAFIMAVTWGLAGTLDINGRDAYDAYFRSLWKGEIEGLEEEVVEGSQELGIPSEGILHDYFYVFKAKGQWKYWPDYLKTIKTDESSMKDFYMVPTVETTKYTFMMELCVTNKIPFLVTGPTGTGKSFYIQNLMMTLNTDIFTPAFITFTTSTSANMLQDLVITKLNKLRRGIYGAPKGKHCVIFIDDCNLPNKEQYGAIPAIELIRQFFDHGNWYDLKDMTKLLLTRVMFIAAMGLPGGSRQEIYQRFLRHFNLFSINAFSDESMTKIFTNLLFFGWRRNGFPTDVMPICNQIVAATNYIFKSAAENLLPTPMKSHYLFNLRDFARVITGMLLLRKESAENKRTYVRLWVHEILRVFYDRLVDIEDREWLFGSVKLTVKDYFRETFDFIMDKLEPNPDVKEVSEGALRNLMFTTALDVDAEEARKYEEIPNLEKFHQVAVNSIAEYNSTHKNKMTVVLFRYALEHLSRILRVLSMPCGSALLVGVGGSGRQSLAKLAGSILQQTIMQPEITKSYGYNEWRDDLKKVLKESGGRNKPVIFLMNEGQIKEDYFLQDIDALLNSGEVPNIFPIDEIQEIIEMVRLAAQGGNRNVEVSSQTVIFHFIQRCRMNLHIVLCLSPVGSALRTRLRLYPSLVNCCTIDWYEGWPEDALERVAKEYLSTVSVSEEIKVSAVHLCKYFHISTRETGDEFFAKLRRKIYVTSASYLDLIKSYSELIKFKQEETIASKMRYIGGLDKLEFAGGQVAIMKQELEALQPQLKVAAAETQAMLSIIEKETLEVEKASELVKGDEVVANKQAEEANALKIDCENELALAIPILEDALAALNILKPADITLVKSMKNPPDTVKLVMAAVCVMKEIKPEKMPDPNNPGKKIMDFWGPSKKLLGDMQFLQSLKDYNKDRIPAAVMQIIRKVYLPNKDFKPEVVAKASSAAEGLCKWVIAMDKYDLVIKEVEPKKQKLEQAEREFSDTMALLNSKREQLRLIEEKLKNLNLKFEEALEKKKRLQEEVRSCSSKLEKAEKIIGSLGGEKTRWKLASEDLQKAYECLPGDMLISCGIIAYLAPFTAYYRQKLIDEWTQLCRKYKIPMSAEFELVGILGSDIKIQAWNIHGLPRDSFSIENAVILEWSKRFSLLIDPQGQANKWIKQMEKESDLEVVKLSDDGYMKKVEVGIEYGKPVLIEGVGEDLDPPLDPILMKQTFTQGGKKFITLGDNVMEYNVNFRLYITTKLANPHYLPEVFNKVTIINFAITLEGLSDQLLGIVVAKDRPDLQEKREVLTIQGAANRRALKEVEDKILETLSSVKGNILEDETAVNILDSSKALSRDIKAKEEVAKETQIIIEEFRLKYKPVAVHCAGLYYTITDLPAVDPMYVYSLPWFITIFTHSVDNSRKSKDILERIFYISEFFNYALYKNVCRSLFDKDKLLYSFILCTTLLMNKDIITLEEFDFLLTGGVGVDASTLPKNPAPEWLLERAWVQICILDQKKKFSGIKKSIESQLKIWEDFYEDSSPSFDGLPDGWSDKLTSFQVIVMIQVLRPDLLLRGLIWLVTKELGIRFIEPPMFDIMSCYHDSTIATPIIFVLSAGMDPMQSLLLFAAKMDLLDHFFYISLGQGQGERARQMIEQGQRQGNWVCLQNCHLAASWMPHLEKIVESIDPLETHPDFRLWLTSYPSPEFPTSLLQSGVKMTNEPPTGLKENILRCYTADPVSDQLFYYSCGESKNANFARLLFGLTFFHTVVLERKKYGSIGWNVPYGFNDSDYLISVQQLQMYMIEREESALKAVTYLSGECNYGGRVTDAWDRRCLTALLVGCISQKLLDDPSFSFVLGDPTFILPMRTSYKDFLKHIEKLPSTPSPEVFGLNMNAGIRRNFNETKAFLDSLVAMKGEAMAAKGSQQDEIVTHVAKDIYSKLPPLFDIDTVSQAYPTEYRESMNTVLVQEMERYNRLLAVVLRTLVALQKAVKGLLVMTPELEAIYTSLLTGRVPAAWAKASYPSLKPLGSYINDFVMRLQYMQTWYEKGKPKWFWLSGFYFTQAFLTGGMQNFARKYAIPIDTLSYDHEIVEFAPEGTSPADGVYVYGMFLEGTRWNTEKQKLDEQKPKVLSEELPLLWVKPIKRERLKERGRYLCPLYKTSERKGILSTTGHSTNYVLPILLETEQEPDHWVRRGAALLCQLDN